MKIEYLASESVTEGHPDKLCDQISDAVLDAYLKQDPKSRVACETFVCGNNLIIGGEITSQGKVDVEKLARQVIKNIGYDSEAKGLNYKKAKITLLLQRQSPDIAMGVSKKDPMEQGAGDQGVIYGYAVNETKSLMPLPIALAHRLAGKLAEVRKNKILPFLLPDGKTQVVAEYRGGRPKRIKNILISAQHTPETSMPKLKTGLIEKVIKPIVPANLMDKNTEIFVNPTGRFVIGGPAGDTGLTGRKIIVDTYGGAAKHGGGAFCIAGNSRINTEKGTLKIDECKAIVGSLVKTDIHPLTAGEWWDNGIKETTIINTKDGFNLEATPDHLVRVIDQDGNYIWKEIGKIQDGDCIAIQKKNRLFGDGSIGNFQYQYKEGTAESRKKKYQFPKKLTDDYAYFLGLLMGDGDCTDDGWVKICVCKKEQITNVQNLFKRLFGEKGKIYGHWAYLGGVELRAYLAFLGLPQVKSFDKTVPRAIWNGTRTNVASFLRGLFDTNGSVRLNGRHKVSLRIHLATTSKQLAEEAQLLLLNFGIISHLHKTNSEGKSAVIRGRVIVSKRALYNLWIKGSEGVKIFRDEIGFGLSRKLAILNKINLNQKEDRGVIPNQRLRIMKLFKTLPLDEQKRDSIRIARFTRKSEGKATKNLTYQKLKSFLMSYEKFLQGNPDFEYLKTLYQMKHHYTIALSRIPSFSRTFDLNIPVTHTFTANGFVVHNSGKDPSKVDRSAAYAMRWVAKNLVAAGLCQKAEVKIAYAIGLSQPLAFNVNTFGTGVIPDNEIAEITQKIFDFRPAAIIRDLSLLRPIYFQTASYGHFGRTDINLPWEKTNKTGALKKQI
jgi:S-adenosylmethionine synthetase